MKFQENPLLVLGYQDVYWSLIVRICVLTCFGLNMTLQCTRTCTRPYPSWSRLSVFSNQLDAPGSRSNLRYQASLSLRALRVMKSWFESSQDLYSVSAFLLPGNVLAFAVTCQLQVQNRPVLGFLNMNAGNFIPDSDHESQFISNVGGEGGFLIRLHFGEQNLLSIRLLEIIF